MILQTNLDHIASEEEYDKILKENENVMICCGRMGPMCLPVYAAMEELKPDYKHVKFYDMAFDAPFAHVIRNHPGGAGFMGLPFTMYYKNGEVVEATSSIQYSNQVRIILDENFSE